MHIPYMSKKGKHGLGQKVLSAKYVEYISWVLRAHCRGEIGMTGSCLCFRWLTPVSGKRPEVGSKFLVSFGSEFILII